MRLPAVRSKTILSEITTQPTLLGSSRVSIFFSKNLLFSIGAGCLSCVPGEILIVSSQ